MTHVWYMSIPITFQVQDAGGNLTMEDLANYEVVLRDPIHIDFQSESV